MSFFGRNIKKIRIAKNISQTTFADLFKLTRASIGAYEEGRAEAKIDTVIEIADYFQLTLDQLLKKELTINDIYHIGDINKKLDLSKISSQQETEIPFISFSIHDEFIRKFNNHNHLQSLQTIKLPGLIKGSIAFEYTESINPNRYSGLKQGDILITQKVSNQDINQNVKDQLYIILIDSVIIMSKIKISEDGKIYFPDIQQVNNLNKSESIKVIWSIYQVISNRNSISDQIELRLQNIENQLNKLISDAN